MTLKLSEDLRQALRQNPGSFVALEDDQSHDVYVVLPREELRRLLDDDLQRKLQVAIDQVERGEVEEWDIEATLTEARRRSDARRG
jgi:GTPase Era involved in 16S rRNA processing